MLGLRPRLWKLEAEGDECVLFWQFLIELNKRPPTCFCCLLMTSEYPHSSWIWGLYCITENVSQKCTLNDSTCAGQGGQDNSHSTGSSGQLRVVGTERSLHSLLLMKSNNGFYRRDGTGRIEEEIEFKSKIKCSILVGCWHSSVFNSRGLELELMDPIWIPFGSHPDVTGHLVH